MAIVRHSIKEFEKYVPLSEKNIEKLSLFGTPVELLDKEIEIEVNPNRPDLIPLQGLVRAFKTFQGKTKLKKYSINKPEKNYKVVVDKSVKEIRPDTVCAIVKNLELDNEKIKDLVNVQEKIHSTMGRNRKKLAIGIYPLDKIKFPLRYEAKNPLNIKFTPLGSEKEMNAQQILKRHVTGKEYAHLLKGKQKFPIFTDANKKILSLPPIINSNETGKIVENTKDLFIECTGFNTDTLNKTLNILVTSLIDMGGTAYSMKIEDRKKQITPDLTTEKMKISLENVNKLLGINLKEKEMVNLLNKMGHKYKKGFALVSAWRTDILHEVDLIEDIAIAYGYDNFDSEIPELSTIGEESRENKLKSKIAELLIGLNLLEISSYHLMKKEEVKKMKLKNVLEVENSKTEYKVLRQDLLSSVLRVLSKNKDKEYPQNIFEIGKVFSQDESKETGINEQTNLIIALTPGNFTEIKQHLEYLGKMLDLSYNIKETIQQGFIEGRTGSIILHDKEIGHFGEVHPNTLKTWNLKMPLAILELNLDEIIEKIAG